MTETKRTRFVTIVGMALALGVAVPNARAAEDAASAKAREAFDRLKSLAGRWEATNASGKTTTVTYELVSNGSLLLERYIEPAPESADMTTAFHVDGGRLLLTHYCSAGNQPRMAASGVEDNTIQFKFLDATNLPDSQAGHIHTAVFRFQDANHFVSEWTWYQDGKGVHTDVRRHTRATP